MTPNSNFLSSVATYFGTPGYDKPSMATLTFVLPNKRSVLFLKKYFREQSREVTLMPRFMTMGTFVSIYADYPATHARELLFVLYEAYRKVMATRGRADDVRQFDGFVFWGDMMLGDFDDIDKALVDADDIFRNLKNVKEIQADYLDDDQKEIVRRVWGESRLTAHIEEFWLHIGDKPEATLSQKFIFLWEILADIYREYKSLLSQRHIASDGELYRIASQRVKDYDQYDFTGDTRYAFVGFNDLSVAETLIFERLHRAGVALFFWDTAPLTLFADVRGSSLPKPLKRLETLVKNYPMPSDYSVPVSDALPKVSLTSVPSNVAQAKAVTNVLADWIAKGYVNADNALDTAIVLPDESLLLPTLLSIPADIKTLNISMGLAYRTTTFASLFHAIISMQMRARMIRGEYNFFYEDINTVLSHPHIQTVAAEAANKVTLYVNENKLYNAPAADLCSVAPELKAIFAPVHKSANVRQVADYMASLLDWLGAALKANIDAAPNKAGRTFELEAIKYFRSELDRLAELIDRHGIAMADHTFLYLFERIFNNRGLTLTGTPLQGLQVLGVLETRALDFDNVIVLSMNEGVFPRKQYAKTMIPNNLRSGYGLPDFDSDEWTYAYSFYRLIARAKRVALFYDSRSEGFGQGERSRYVAQLEYLIPKLDITGYTMTTGSTSCASSTFEIAKTDSIMARLKRYQAGGKKKLSASSLKKYLECPFRFYLEYVRDLRDDDELSEGLSAAEVGTIVHNTIQAIYQGNPSATIDSATFDRWLDPQSDIIRRTVAEQINSVHLRKESCADYGHFSTELKIAATNLEVLVRSNLEAERDAYSQPPFTFVENEYQVDTIADGKPWQLTPDLAINFFMSVDRVDQLLPGLLRFIDFKTGSDETSVESFNALFTAYKHKKGGIFQLLLYCEAYLSLREPDIDIVPMLHALRKLAAATPIKPLKVERKYIDSYLEVRDKFRPMLVELIEEIFNKDLPFRQCADTDACEYCPFLALCGRELKKF